MSYNDNLTGALFPNGNKQYENSPDMTGSCVVSGVTYNIGGWFHETPDGRKYVKMRLTVRKPRDGAEKKDNA